MQLMAIRLIAQSRRDLCVKKVFFLFVSLRHIPNAILTSKPLSTSSTQRIFFRQLARQMLKEREMCKKQTSSREA